MSFAPFIVCDVCGSGAPLEFDEAIESDEFGKGDSYKLPKDWTVFGDGPTPEESDNVVHACPKESCKTTLRAKAVS